MRTKKVTRYYCDHCSRGHFQKPSAARHEISCVKNPHRVCGMCEQWISPVRELSAIVDKVGDLGEEEMMKELTEATEGCPACMLAAIRQSKEYNIKAPALSDEPPRHWFTFDYKTAARLYMEEKRARECEEHRFIVAGF